MLVWTSWKPLEDCEKQLLPCKKKWSHTPTFPYFHIMEGMIICCKECSVAITPPVLCRIWQGKYLEYSISKSCKWFNTTCLVWNKLNIQNTAVHESAVSVRPESKVGGGWGGGGVRPTLPKLTIWHVHALHTATGVQSRRLHTSARLKIRDRSQGIRVGPGPNFSILLQQEQHISTSHSPNAAKICNQLVGFLQSPGQQKHCLDEKLNLACFYSVISSVWVSFYCHCLQFGCRPDQDVALQQCWCSLCFMLCSGWLRFGFFLIKYSGPLCFFKNWFIHVWFGKFPCFSILVWIQYFGGPLQTSTAMKGECEGFKNLSTTLFTLVGSSRFSAPTRRAVFNVWTRWASHS